MRKQGRHVHRHFCSCQHHYNLASTTLDFADYPLPSRFVEGAPSYADAGFNGWIEPLVASLFQTEAYWTSLADVAPLRNR